jgi:hypothetical protein
LDAGATIDEVLNQTRGFNRTFTNPQYVQFISVATLFVPRTRTSSKPTLNTHTIESVPAANYCVHQSASTPLTADACQIAGKRCRVWH